LLIFPDSLLFFLYANNPIKCYLVTIRRNNKAINVEKTHAAFQKLYGKKAALDKIILTVQKALAIASGEASNVTNVVTKKLVS